MAAAWAAQDFLVGAAVLLLVLVGKFTRQESRLLMASLCALLVQPSISMILVMATVGLVLAVVDQARRFLT